MLDRHLTHRLPLFSLGWLVFEVTHAGWELCGTTRVLLHCLPPGHVSLCVCFCVCFWGRQRWHDYYQENTFKILALNQKIKLRDSERMMWTVCNSSTVLLLPVFFVSSLLSLFLSHQFWHFQFLALMLSCQFMWFSSSMAGVYPHPSLTLALQGWPRLGKDAAAFIHPLAPSAPSHSPRSAVPSIAMATAGAVDEEGCLEWQPWQESGPSNDPGGKGRRKKDGEQERREPGKGQCR